MYYPDSPQIRNVVDSKADDEVYQDDGHHHDEEQDDDLDKHHVVSAVAVRSSHLAVVQLSQQHRDHYHETVVN